MSLVTKSKSGFTIIEMAIVTVIIGTLIAAIFVGNNVLDAAKRNSIIEEINAYKSAVINFQLKYSELPGDMDNANEYWSSANNGDGNGYIRGTTTENRYAWRHLSYSEFLKKNYDGAATTEYMPESNIGNAYYKLDTAGGTGGGVGSGSSDWNLSTNTVYQKSGNFLALGGIMEGGTLIHAHGITSAQDTQNIDLKLDNGNASSGTIVAIRGYSWNGSTNDLMSGCVDSSAYSSASEGSVDYDLSDDTESCLIMYFFKGIN